MSDFWNWLDKLGDYADNVPFAGQGFRVYSHFYKTKNSGWKTLDKNYNLFKGVYDRTDLDAYEWRAKHSNDYLIGTFMRKANARDLYNEQVAMQNDKKRHTGYDWKDNAYPRTAFGSAFGGSVGFANSSPVYDVNKAILELYNGVSKW